MNDMKLSDLLTIVNALSNKSDNDFWEIGENYFIRTVTMHLVGKVMRVTDKEILLEDASWIADSGRFHEALSSGEFEEIEPFVNAVIVNRNSVIDATIFSHALPKEAK